jgi:hypothetical protein
MLDPRPLAAGPRWLSACAAASRQSGENKLSLEATLAYRQL